MRVIFSGWVKVFKVNQGISSEIVIDDSIMFDVCHRYAEDIERLKRFNNLKSLEITKRMAFLAFWIRKLKPLHYEGNVAEKFPLNYLNEHFGLTVALISLEIGYPFPIKLEQRFYADTLHEFRYKSVSPHSLNIIFKAIVTDCKGDKYSV
jgi:hypothetical protein